MDLLAAVRTDSAMRAFVENGGLSATLSEIHGEHISGAQEALKCLQQGENPRSVIKRVLDYLQAAHVFFRSSWKDNRRFNLNCNLEIENADLWVCCLAAVCHKYLGDDPRMIEEKLVAAGQALRSVGTMRLFLETLITSATKGFMWIDFRHSKCAEDLPKFTKDEFEQFCRLMRV